MRRAHRLTRAPEIERTRREGKRVRTGSLELRAVASLHALPRVGVVVPKYKHSSVERNRLKRRLRELLRLDLLPALDAFAAPLDVLVRALPSAYSRAFDGLQRELRAAERELRRLAPTLAPLAPPADPPRTEG